MQEPRHREHFSITKSTLVGSRYDGHIALRAALHLGVESAIDKLAGFSRVRTCSVQFALCRRVAALFECPERLGDCRVNARRSAV